MSEAKKNTNQELSSRSSGEQNTLAALMQHHQQLLPELGDSWNGHSVVTMTRQTLSRIVYYHQLYQKILNVPGVICEFGVQWGATLSLLTAFRGMYEPYNYSRKLFGFDTFEGFCQVDKTFDGNHLHTGDYRVAAGHKNRLEQILTLHESQSPLSHIKKFELIQGDASATVTEWLEQNPHAIISMAIFDMDLYQPTKDVLTAILPRLTKGSVLVFDELNHSGFPGETKAVMEVLGLNNIRLERFPHQANCAWAVFE